MPTKYPWPIVIGVVALAIPCTLAAVRMQRTLSTLEFTPRGSEGTLGFTSVSDNFGAGSLFQASVKV